MGSFKAGYAGVEFTPEPGQWLQGQHFARRADRTRDPLMAIAAAFGSREEIVVIAAADMCFLPTRLAAEAQRRFEERTGLPGNRLLVHATHSHVAPYSFPDYWGQPDPAFLERLCEAVVEAAKNAAGRMEEASVYSGAGTMSYLGWNRRAMFADGTSAMHGPSNRPDFIGSEGPRDPALSVLFTRSNGRITGAIVNFANHPNSVECELYYSADIPGEVRRLLKLMLGEDVAVVYLTGAAGNVTPLILEPYTKDQPWMGEEGLRRSGLYLAGEAAKVIASCVEPAEAAVLRVEQAALPIPIRPYPAPGTTCYPQPPSGEAAERYRREEVAWPDRMREHSPVEVRVNVVRVGDAVVCTNPAELFVEFGLQIRQASPAKTTIISELTDGYVGYVPTPLAFSRGGYETWPAFTSQLVPEAGDQIVDATRKLLEEAFRG